MRKLSYLLIIILLSSFVNLLPVNIYSQPNGCININGIKTPEIEAQFETWLNEHDGLNARFLDETESSFERGQRTFYDLVLNNNQICLSDLTQEMIDSITEIIRSYDNAVDHSYLVNGITITRSQMNLGFKAIRDPIILLNPSNNIFAEAVQTGVPIADIDSLQVGTWMPDGGLFACAFAGVDCFLFIDEGSPANINFIDTNVNPVGDTYWSNLTSLIDPENNDDHVFNFTARKNVAAGRQIDFNVTIIQGETLIIQTEILVDISAVITQYNVSIASANATLITDYTNLNQFVKVDTIGGGASRTPQFFMIQLVIPDGPAPIVSDPTLWGLFNTSDTLYSILSLEGRDKVFQDMQVRLNLTIVDPQGRNNISEVHANFNSTLNDPLFLLSFYNDSGTFIFNTTTPLIVQNLEGLNTEITNGWNITFIFSLSRTLEPGYYWLSNANATDNTNNSTIVRERWFSFIRDPGLAVSTGTSELFPLAPLMNLFFIIGGFLLVFNAKGRLEFQASGMFFFLASLLFIISPIYAILDSNNVLSYEILNYPDSIRNNFVLINFVFIGLGLTSVIINNKAKLGFR